MQEVEAICRRTIIINKGVVVANASVEDMQKGSVAKGRTVLVEFSAPLHASDFREVPGVVKILPLNENKWLIHSRKEVDIRPALFHFAVERKIAVLEMQQQERSLEEVFHELTQFVQHK
jgi:ABC-2 type transport system ATP-binding protein